MSTVQAKTTGLSRRTFLASLSAGSLVLMSKANGQATTVADATKTDVENFAPDFFDSMAESCAAALSPSLPTAR